MASTSSRPKINILLVDEDIICLSILAKVLERMNYQVATFKSSLDALLTLRKRKSSFDLVLTNVHMPEMSGLELLKIVDKEFKLPVVLMSDNNNTDIMIKGLEDGAAFFLVKPISTNYLSRLWQYVIPVDSTNKSSNTSSNSTRALPSMSMPSINTSISSDLRINDRQQLISQFNNNKNNISNVNNSKIVLNDQFKANTELFYSNNLLKRPNTNDLRMRDGCANKKPRLIWTTPLHNLFLEAVNKLGVEKAMPKQILEYMNIPGLRRENIASHLQKYRLFLERIQEATNSTQDGISNSWNERPFRSSFVLNEITFLTNNLHQQYLEFMAHAQDLFNGASVFEKGQSSNQVLNSSAEAICPTNETVQTDHIKLNANQGTQTKIQNDEKHNQLSISNGCQQGHSIGFNFVQKQSSQGITNPKTPRVSNLQPTTKNNVGIHISSNEELIIPFNSSSTINVNNGAIDDFANGMLDNNFTENIRANEVNYGMNYVDNHNSFQNNSNATALDHTIGLDNMNIYLPNIDHNATQQTNPFGISSTGLSEKQSIQFNQETFDNEFGFGSYDVEGDDLGCLLKNLDQGITANNDISFEYYFAQDEFNKQDGVSSSAEPANY